MLGSALVQAKVYGWRQTINITKQNKSEVGLWSRLKGTLQVQRANNKPNLKQTMFDSQLGFGMPLFLPSLVWHITQWCHKFKDCRN